MEAIKKNNTIAQPILKIREAIKEIKFDARDERVPKVVLKRFIHCIDNVTDIRSQELISYPLSYIILLAFLAVLSGADSWYEMANFSESYKIKLNGILPNFKSLGIPSHDTFRRILGLLRPDELQKAVVAFLVNEIEQLKQALGVNDGNYIGDGGIKNKRVRLICIDGKEQKGTGRKYNTTQEIRNLQTFHCYDASNGICLYSVPIDKKTNEIPVAQKLLEQMQLKNCVVTFDAMNTQKDTVKIIIDNGGDYVGGLKGNHKKFYNEILDYFTETELTYIRFKNRNYREYTEKSHNSIETRRYYMTTDIKRFSELSTWSGCRSIVCSEKRIEDLVTKEFKIERLYYIASSTDIEFVSDAIRGHWNVENQLHWHLDVTFSEDDNTTIDKNAFNNLSILNKLALSLLKLIQPAYKHKTGLKGIRKKFGWDLINQLTFMLGLLDEETIAEALQKSSNKIKS